MFEPAAPAEDEGVAEATSQLHEEADASPDAVPVEADVHHDAEAPVEAGAVDEERQVVEMAQPSLGAEPVPGTEEPSPGSAVTEASPDVAGVGPVESVAVHPDEEELLRFDDEPHAPAWEPSEPPESKPEPVLDEPVPGAGEMEVAVGSALTAGTAATSREVETEATRPDEWPIADLPAAADSAHGARAVEEQPSEEDAALPEAATADAATPEAATPDAPTPVAPTPEDTGDAIPGGRDLDEALAALASLRFGPQARQELRGPAASGSEGRAEPRQGVERDVTAPSESAPAPDAESVGPPEAETWTPDPDWLRGRRGPAASAYRRLRRLFPG